MFVMCKQRVQDVGSKKMVRRDESEWIKIPNHHPAIVSEELLKRQIKCAVHLNSQINSSVAIRFVLRLCAGAVNTQWIMHQRKHLCTDVAIQEMTKRKYALHLRLLSHDPFIGADNSLRWGIYGLSFCIRTAYRYSPAFPHRETAAF